jgi:hypothetical protein
MNTQLEELACLFVLDRLDSAERIAFEVRLLNDSELAALVDSLETALAERIRALPRHEPGEGLLAGIEARIDLLPSAKAPRLGRSRAPLWSTVARWGIAAVIAVGVSTLAVQSLRRPGRPYVIFVGMDSSQSRFTELPMLEYPKDADGQFIRLASLAEHFWEKPEELPVKMGPVDKIGRGYALFDPSSNQGFIAIREIPDVEQGKRYYLWVLDKASGQARDAGVLPLSGSNRGLYFFSVAPSAGAAPGHLNFFVTAEDAADDKTPGPRGKVVLGDEKF